MLTVTRTRLVDSGAKDRYYKPIFTPVATEHVAHAFAPVVTGDVKGADSIVSSDGGTLYFRPPNVTDGLPEDRWTIGGVEYKAEGVSALWVSPDGETAGSVIVVKRTEFTDG